MIKLNVNGKPRNLDIPDDMPSPWAEKIEAARRAVPQPLSDWKVAARLTGKTIALTLEAPRGTSNPFGGFHFFSENEGMVEPSGLQTLKKVGAAYVLTIPVAAQPTGDFKTLSGVLVADRAWPKTEVRAVSFSAPLRR